MERIKCLQLIGSNEENKWHSRLGHVNVETMKLMANNKPVFGLPKMTMEKETFASCLRGKKHDKDFLKQAHTKPHNLVS